MPPEMQAQIQHLMQSVDAISIEVETHLGGRRFATKLLEAKAEGGRKNGRSRLTKGCAAQLNETPG